MNSLRKRLPLLAVVAGLALLAIAAVPGGAAPGQPASLTRPATPGKVLDPNGFVQRWLLLEPIKIPIRSNAELIDSYVQATLKKEYFPGQLTVLPHEGDKVTVDGTELAWHAVDTSGYHVNLYHFAYDMHKPALNVVFWAVTTVNAPQEMRGVRLAVGSNSASIWWLDGKEVIDLYGDRHLIIDDGVSKRLTLNKGANVLRCAVVNAPGVSDMCARFLDAQDKPIKGLTVTLN